ncbi:hypothetical protein BT63DRAFT_422582 [Microthyrium microscopicum]|uniref:Uncharacterized protein n=1 Tax=Microthyrium microscopicum TaxID=703497 RepID=A0A6A6UMD7_9PEZI|nr:hypothetical protein BT63DRAFT_422582 [Microthyrium microscopicum]
MSTSSWFNVSTAPTTYCYNTANGLDLGGGTIYTNCTEICTDPHRLFSSNSTFLGCITFYAPSGDSVAALLRSQSFSNSFSSMINLINNCMSDYCHSPDSTLEGCLKNGAAPRIELSQAAVVQKSELFPSLIRFTGLTEQFSSSGACEVNKIVNADLGGSGIFVSYIVQLGLALFFCVALLLLKYEVFRWIKQGTKVSKECSVTVREVDTLKSILRDFQEGQCFFVIITQLVAIAACANKGQLLGSTNGLQAQANHQFLQTISVVGSTVVTFVAGMIANCDTLSTYHTILSLLSILVSMALGIFSTTGNDHGLPSKPRLSSSSIRPACGNNPPPSIFCGADLLQPLPESKVLEGGLTTTLLFTYFSAEIFLIINLLVNFGMPLRRRLEPISKVLFGRYDLYKIFWIVSALLCLWFATVLGICLYSLVRIAKMGSIDFDTWGIGQIVAVTTWAPLIFRCGYYAISNIITPMKAQPDIRRAGTLRKNTRDSKYPPGTNARSSSPYEPARRVQTYPKAHTEEESLYHNVSVTDHGMDDGNSTFRDENDPQDGDESMELSLLRRPHRTWATSADSIL